MELTRAAPETLDEQITAAWRKIVEHETNYHVYVNFKLHIFCVKEGTQKLVFLQQDSNSALVGIYNAGIKFDDFSEDVLYTLVQVAKWTPSFQ